MATVTITVPTKAINWNDPFHIAQHLAAGNDVIFQDEDGFDIDMHGLNVAVDATVRARTKNQAENQKLDQYYIAGGWHRVAVHKVYATGTTASTKMLVRREA